MLTAQRWSLANARVSHLRSAAPATDSAASDPAPRRTKGRQAWPGLKAASCVHGTCIKSDEWSSAGRLSCHGGALQQYAIGERNVPNKATVCIHEAAVLVTDNNSGKPPGHRSDREKRLVAVDRPHFTAQLQARHSRLQCQAVVTPQRRLHAPRAA